MAGSLFYARWMYTGLLVDLNIFQIVVAGIACGTMLLGLPVIFFVNFTPPRIHLDVLEKENNAANIHSIRWFGDFTQPALIDYFGY